MFKTIFLHELKYWAKQPMVYIYAMLLLLISSQFMGGNSEMIDGEWSKKLINSPIEIYKVVSFFEIFILLLLPSIIGVSIYRDFRSNMHQLLYAYPFKKWDYLLGKFLSGLMVVFAISLFVGLGTYWGTTSTWVDPKSLANFTLMPYLQTYFAFLFPNILVVSAIVFSIVGFTRNVYAGFVFVVIFLLFKEGFSTVISSTESPILAAFSDPSGSNALAYFNQYWTVAERNEMSLPFQGIVVWNRVFWLAISGVFFTVFYRKFEFQQHSLDLLSFKNLASLKTHKTPAETAHSIHIQTINLPQITLDFSLKNQLKTMWSLAKYDFKFIVTHPPFLILTAVSIFALTFMVSKGAIRWETGQLPTTRNMLEMPIFIFSGIINFITFLYTGLLIHRARMARSNQLIDSNSVPNWVLFLSKFWAIVFIQILLLTLILIGGIATQIYKSYFHFEIGQYFFELYVINLPHFMIWAMLALLVQTLFRNQFLAFFILILFPVAMITIGELAPQLGLDFLKNSILRYNQNPSGRGGALPYSELDGYGTILPIYFTYKFYWILACMILLLTTSLWWIRGLPASFSERMTIVKQRFSKKMGLAFGLLLAVFFSIGFEIYYEENLRFDTFLNEEKKEIFLTIEKEYKHFSTLISPQIESVKMNMDLFPKERGFQASGEYILVNHSNKIIDTVLVNYKIGLNHHFNFNRDFEIINHEKIADLTHLQVIKLKNGLLPNDSLKMTFDLHTSPNSWFHTSHYVKENGTLINNEICPRLGYWLDYLKGEVGLNDFKEAPHPLDTIQLRKQRLIVDSRMIDFECVISTAVDQMAFTPGYLQREWMEGNRRFFHYKMDKKINHSFLFMSGEYEVLKDKWEDVNLEIYYKKGHDYNLDRMMAGMKASLEYQTKYFTPYQFKQVRIIEFAQTGGASAHGFPNTIPWGEGAGFLANIDTTEAGGVDYVFASAVHEVAHQWWGHQVGGAGAQGDLMLAETMAEYVNISVLEQQYGKAKVRQYLRAEMGKYLDRRTRERHIERPLMYGNSSQPYVHYAKGAIVFHAFRHYLGEKNFNRAIQKFLQNHQAGAYEFTTALEMGNCIREVIPDSLAYLMTDLLETVTLYDSKISQVKTTQLENGQYQINLDFLVSKYRSEGKGNKVFQNELGDSLTYQTDEMTEPIYSLPLADFIEIGVFDGDKELYLEQHKITEIGNRLSIVVDEKPTLVGVDPYGVFIDVQRRDNLRKVD